MNTSLTIIAKIQNAGFALELLGDSIKVSPASRLNDAQRRFIREHKREIVEVLKSAGSGFHPALPTPTPLSSCTSYTSYTPNTFPTPIEPPTALTLEGLSHDQKLELLPDDRKWLQQLLQWKSPTGIHELLVEYRRLWLEVMEQEQMEHCKQNAGRFKANTWIRLEVTGA